MRSASLEIAPAPSPGRPLRTVVIAAALAAVALLPASPAAAADHLIFHVYVAGPNGGTIELESGAAVPAGTCGIRVHDPEYWYWAEGDYAETGELDLLHNGAPVDVIEISGAFAGCEQTPYSAVTPATPAGWPPDDAISLVIEGWSNDVEYLDYNNDPLPVPIPPDPPEPPGGICEMYPEFCEEPPPLTILPFCLAHPDLCLPYEAQNLNLVRASDLAGAVVVELGRAQVLLKTPANRKAALAGLTLAQEHAGFAAAAVRALRLQDDEVAKALSASSHVPRTYAIADRASARIELGNVAAGECVRALDAARRRLAGGGVPVLAPAIASCGRTGDLLTGGRAASDALRAWALSAEGR